MSDPAVETPKESPPVVPEVFLPAAVRRAAARAEELIAQQHASDTPAGPDQPPLVTEPPPHEPPPQPSPEPPPAASDWEQRYRTLQGKYDTEISALRGQVAGLERLLATMQQPAAPPPVAAPSPSEPVQFAQEDIDLYGEDLLQAMARTAEARSRPYIAQLEAKVARLEGGQQDLAGQQLERRMFAALDSDPELAGRWDKINRSSGFHAWLAGVDEYSGVTRQEMLRHAYLSEDAVRTGRFFKKYMAEHTVPPIATQTQTAPAPVASGNYYPNGNGHAAPAGAPRLEDFAVPGRAGGNGQGGNGALPKRIWTRDEIKAFYQDRIRGKFRGREDEATRLEKDLETANAEGRIQ